MPFKTSEKKRAWARRYGPIRAAKVAADPVLKQAQLARKRAEKARYDARQRAKKLPPIFSPLAKATACQWRLHKLAPDGDLKALRERVKKECEQWKSA